MSLGKFSSRDPIGDKWQEIDTTPIKKKIKKPVALKQVYKQETNSFEEKPVDKKEEKQLEILKAEPKKNDQPTGQAGITFETLHADLLKINEKLNEKQIVSEEEDDYEFVENIETVDTGGNVINEIIRLRHTDIVIVVTNDSITLFESLEDYDKKKDHLGIFVFEESEKSEIIFEEDKDAKSQKDYISNNPSDLRLQIEKEKNKK